MNRRRRPPSGAAASCRRTSCSGYIRNWILFASDLFVCQAFSHYQCRATAISACLSETFFSFLLPNQQIVGLSLSNTRKGSHHDTLDKVPHFVRANSGSSRFNCWPASENVSLQAKVYLLLERAYSLAGSVCDPFFSVAFSVEEQIEPPTRLQIETRKSKRRQFAALCAFICSWTFTWSPRVTVSQGI